ncbi:Hsp20/alpha crystallin family protein [Halolamina pelagica]|uniref:Hsp20/alpha crystallin family protein n=1 Tax=Halolamina pelagica TaxID=699431 RepID=A0A0P7H1A5_9EURY|nr:Hsp20/alpha crystallin family protein [Halolamina pelagica]KPN32143.1 Hsp20/alpha crystallin family protein [Halolamina pelagica]
MALPENLTSSWTQGLDLPSRLFETGSTDYELFEEDGEFVLSVEMPGFDPESITVSWDEGVLNIAAEHEDTQRGRRRTYHRRFRFPKSIDDEEIAAEYNNGILEVRLPILADAAVSGTEIEVQS